MEDKELKDYTVIELMEILTEGYKALEGCSTEEAKAGVDWIIKGCLIKEIEWVGEMLEK